MSDGGHQETVQKTEPPEIAQPYLKEIFSGAQQWYRSAQPQYYPGSTVAEFTPAQMQAQQGIMARALAGSPLLKAAQAGVGDILSGKGFSDAVFRAVESKVAPAVAARYTAAGRTPSGSALYADTLARALTEGYAPYAAGLYQYALGAAPSLAAQDYADLAALAQLGREQQAQRQAEINADIERFNFGQQRDFNKLAQYLNLIQGATAGYGTRTQITPSVPLWEQLAAAGLGGLSAAAQLSSTPALGWYIP